MSSIASKQWPATSLTLHLIYLCLQLLDLLHCLSLIISTAVMVDTSSGGCVMHGVLHRVAAVTRKHRGIANQLCNGWWISGIQHLMPVLYVM
jgi:hypothetical protein